MKMKVTVHRNANYFPEVIEIQRGRRAKVTVKQTPSPTGEVYNIEIEGKRERLPSFTEILAMVNARRLDRIGVIEAVDLITLISEITTIKKIESIDNIPSITLYGSEGVALAQTVGTGAAWVSPTDHDDVDYDWLNEANAYNDNQGNAAYSLMDFGIFWYGFLELELAAAVQANKVRFWIFQERLGADVEGRKVDIDVEKDGSWVHVDEITDFAQKEWIERSFTQGSVTKVRLRFWNPIELETIARIYDVDVYQVATAGGLLQVQVIP